MPRLGELLVEENRISPEQLDYALYFQAVHGGRLGRNLIRLGFATEEQVTAALARKYGIPSVDLERVQVSPSVLRLLPLEHAIRYRSLPISLNRTTLQIAMVDPNDVAALDDLQFLTGCRIRPVLAPETLLVQAIYERLGRVDLETPDGSPTPHDSTPAQLHDLHVQFTSGGLATRVIEACHNLLAKAVHWKVSDIHVESYFDSWRIRFRIDGTLHTVADGRTSATGRSNARAVINRFCRMAQLVPTETRFSQEGRLSFRSGSAESEQVFEFDVSWMCLLFGEKLVLRRVYIDEAPEKGSGQKPEMARKEIRIDPFPGWTHEKKTEALTAAARRGDTGTVQLCVQAGADPNPGTGRYPPLWAAVMSGNESTVRALTEVGAGISAEPHDRAMLRAAVEDGHAECVRIVLDARAALNELSEDGWARDALEAAASAGQRELLNWLLERRVPPSATALRKAAAAGQLAIIAELIPAALRIRLPQRVFRCALVAAADGGHAGVVGAFLELARGSLSSSAFDRALGTAVPSGSFSKLWRSYSARFGMTDTTFRKCYKKLTEYAETATCLLKAGANPNARAYSGPPVVVAAAESGQIRVLPALIAAGADVNVTLEDGWTPLIGAIEGRHPDCVRTLLEAGAEVTADAFRRMTGPGHEESFQLLTELGSTVRWKHGDLKVSVRWAEHRGHSEIVDQLFKASAHGEIQQEVREKIIDAFKVRATSLDLSRHSLKTLPAEIGLLSELESLDLNYNYLSELPAELARLSNLRTLQLTGNQLTDLPKPIYSLQKLETLNVAGNPLKSGLREAMSKLTALRMLITDSGPFIRKPSAPTQAGRNDHLASDKLSPTQSSVEATPSQRKRPLRRRRRKRRPR